jgi:hypothetical protein
MDDKGPLIELPPNGSMAKAIEDVLDSLTDKQGTEFLFDLDKWAVTVQNARKRLGMLNGRYEVCVLEGHAPITWIVGAYDTTEEKFVLAALSSQPPRPDLQAAGNLCADALNETQRIITP